MLYRFCLIFLLCGLVALPAQATVNEVDPASNRSTGNGTTKVFPYTFKILTKNDLQVSVDSAVKTVDTHYTVSGLGVDAGGNVTFLTAPPNGSVVTILRKQPASQLSRYNPNEAFPSQRIERDYDKVTMQIQQAKELLSRTYHLPLTEQGSEALTVMPSLSLRANKYMGWNASGEPTAMAATGGGGGGTGDLTDVVAGAGVTVTAPDGPSPTVTWAPSTYVGNITFWDGANASRTLTAGLSGASDPVLTFSDGIIDLTTGVFKQGGVAVVTDSSTSTLSNKTLAAPIVTGTITLPDGVKQTFNPDATLAGINIGSQAGLVATPANGDMWYDSTGNKFKCRENGVTVDCINTAAGSGDLTDVIAGAGISVSSGTGPDPTVTWAPDTQVNNLTFWNGANTPRTITFAVTGTDPVLSFAASSMDLTAGTLKQGGVNVLTETGSQTATNKTLVAPIITGAVTFPDGVPQIFNPDATLAGINVGAVAGNPGSPVNGDLWYDSTANKYRCQENGVTVDCINTAAGAGDLNDVVAGTGIAVATPGGPSPVVSWAPDTQVSSFTLFNSASASRTVTIGLSGATDPVFTFSDGVVDLTTGTLKAGGVTVTRNSASQTLTNKTIDAPIITGAITFPDGVKQVFNPDATLSGFNVGAQAGDVGTPANGDIWYDSTGNKYRCRENGVTVDCLSTGAGMGDVTDVTAGTGIAVANPGGPAPTVSWSPSTQVASFTMFDGSQASRTQTIDLTGTDPVITYSSGVMNLSTGTLQQGGVDVLTSSSTHTMTNKAYDAEGTGNLFTLPRRLWFPAAGIDNATVGSVWDLPTANAAVPAAVTGTNIQKAVLDFANGGNLSAQTSYLLPSTWTGTVAARVLWFSSTTTGNVVWQLSTICVADAETDDPAFNTASPVTDATKGTLNQLNTAAIATVDVTGCAAGELMHLEIRRNAGSGADTMAGTARLVGVELVIREAL